MEDRYGSAREGAGSEPGEGARAAELTVGARIAGFVLQERLSDGGMGVIWRAHEVALNRTVVLKFLRPELREAEHALERFRREAMAEARALHPGIVTVYSVGEAQGQPYIAQELVPGGRTVASLIGEAGARRDHSRAYFRRVAELMAEAADALQAAHEAGVVHRDIKPHNLLLAPEGRLKVADFGLARLTGVKTVTDTGVALGTFCYMSPEQVRGEHGVDFHADVFGLGATLYELLTFKRAFDGDSANAILHKVLHADPPDPRKISAHVPRELSLLCSKALEKRPADRFTSMREFAEELRRFLAGEPLRIHPPSTVHRMRKWVRRHPTSSMSSAVAALALCAVVWLGVIGAGARRGRLQAERDSLYARAQYAIEMDDLEQAAELVAQAGKLDPEDYTGNLILAAGYAKYARTSEAEGEIARARAKGFTSDPAGLGSALEHGAYGLYLQSQRDYTRYPEAEAEIQRALELDPSLYSLQFALYQMRRPRGDIEGARAALRALDGHLASAEPFRVVVQALEQELAGDPHAALSMLEALEGRPDVDDSRRVELRLHRNMGRLCVSVGELERAEELLRRAVAEEPDDCWSWDNLGALYVTRFKRGDYSAEVLASARAAAERAQACSPSLPNPPLVRAYAAVMAFGLEPPVADPLATPAWKSARAALDALRAARAADSPEHARLECELLVLTARVHFARKEFARAAELYQSAIELDSSELEAAALLGQCDWYLKRHAEGLTVLEDALARWDDPSWTGAREERWLGALLAWVLGHGAALGDEVAIGLARERLLAELERGARFAPEELLSAAEFLTAEAPPELRDCALAGKLVEDHDLRNAFAGRHNAAQAQEILARIERACR